MKKNKILIFLLLIAMIGIVGITIAYFSNSTSITNEFNTSEYGTDVTETFTSPTGWQPGDETPKVLTVKNTGEVDEAVRIKVEEKWINKNGEELPLTQDGNVAAQINYINEDDWTRVDVANEGYYYYYYNYKLAPDEETTELLDKVTFNPLINASTTCTDSIGTNGETTRSCTSNGNGYDGATYTLKFTIETVQYNKYQEAWGTDLVIKEEKPNPLTVQEFLAAKTNPVTITNYADGNIHEMYTFEHEATAQTPALRDYRYIGNDPYNYVYFNCDDLDNQDSETCEVWRIIGVFDVEREIDDEENPGQKKTITETRIKLVRGNELSKQRILINSSSRDWTIADTSSDLKTFLNVRYYNRMDDAQNDGLKESARQMIQEAKYYLGASWANNSTEQLYSLERSDTLCGNCGNDTTKLFWYGMVGLMYSSDQYMVYGMRISNRCYDNPSNCTRLSDEAPTGWIYNSNILENTTNICERTWLMTPYAGYNSTNSQYVKHFRSTTYGDLDKNAGGHYDGGVRPVLYLSSDVKILSGTGEESNPYKLSL